MDKILEKLAQESRERQARADLLWWAGLAVYGAMLLALAVIFGIAVWNGQI